MPNREEIAHCRHWLQQELQLLQPELLLPVGKLAIQQFLPVAKLDAVIGRQYRLDLDTGSLDVIPLPHPSGASTWHRTEPGRSLLQQALGEFFLSDQVHGWLQLPASAGRLRAAIYRTGEVLQDVPDDVGGWWLEVRISARELEALCRGEDLDCVLRPDREPLRVAGAAQAP